LERIGITKLLHQLGGNLFLIFGFELLCHDI
jgi:hypothetical protein